MTNPNRTLLGIILDRSASMAVIKSDMEAAVNTVISEQRNEPGECLVTLVQFNEQYDVLYNNTPIDKIGFVELIPSGNTALYDTMARTITMMGASLSALDESERPGIVVVAIITDGQENASKEFRGQQGQEQIRRMVETQTNVYSWQFTFLGANQDAVLVGTGLGVAAASSMTYDANREGVQAFAGSFNTLLRGVRASGGSKKMAYSEEDRKRASKTGEPKQ